MKASTRNKLIIVLPVSVVMIAAIIVISFYDSDADGESIILTDDDGTILFEGKMDNETLLNISLNVTMTFRDFIEMMSSCNYCSDEIIIQVANQLKGGKLHEGKI